MKSTPTFKLLMAAGLYLLLMWGYLILQTPQFFAVFAAMIMCIALLFWVGEARLEAPSSNDPDSDDMFQSVARKPANEWDPTLAASLSRLDMLKDELTQQYAQFGQDQSALNSKGLGTWQQNQARKGDDSE